MPTGIEVDAMKSLVEAAKALIVIAKELQRLNDKLDYMTGKGQLNVLDVGR